MGEDSKVMFVVAIITARQNSTRLKNKMLCDIAGKPMVQRVYERVGQCKLVNKVIVATTPSSKEIISHCRKNNINYTVGDEEDILSRLVDTARVQKAEVIVRVWGDSPLIDPQVIDKGITDFKRDKCDYLYPINLQPGMLYSIVPYHILANVNVSLKNKEDRLWFHNFMISGRKRFNVRQLDYGYSTIVNYSVDDDEDLKFTRKVYEQYGDNFTLQDVLCMK